MQLVFAACRRKKTFFVDFRFATRWAHFFDFIARSHTLLFSSSFTFCFSFFPSYYWVATAHNARNVVVVYCYNLKGCVCACDGMYISKKIFSNPFFSRHRGTHSHAKKKTARIETETNRTEKSIPLRAKSRIFFVTFSKFS